ncbi:MAG: YceI family protein [Bacteroidetes bacterium]|nr:MAG: YceI family protein [Bacteroidota bacterium]
MKNIFLFIALFVFGQASFAQTAWDVKTYSVGFVIKNAGFNVDGSFKGLTYTLKFDEGGANDVINASVDASTINTNNNARDKHLRKSDYFDVEKYPKISLKSVSFTKVSAGKYKGTFKLTIKATTKTVEIPFTFDKGTFVGELTINRLDYGVGESSWVLSNDVKIKVKIN